MRMDSMNVSRVMKFSIPKALITLILFFPIPTRSGEVEECRRIAPKYKATPEFRLWDDTRVDLLNDEYAIEVDYAHKWAEAIGQSLYYSNLTGKKPGIILFVKDIEKERQFVYRLQTVAVKYGITFWIEYIPKELK